MKKLAATFSAAALIAGLSAAPAHAHNWYVEGSLGLTTQNNLDWGGASYKMDNGWDGALAVGASVTPDWDLAAQFSFDRMAYSCCSPNNTHEYRLMANLTRNFTLGGFTPYVGAGLGMSDVTYHNATSHYTRSDTVGAYQVIAGVRAPVGPKWSVFGEYRYQDTFSDPKSKGLVWQDHSNNFAVGVRWAM
jgi:opacity protein-like surface antigen